MSANSDPAEHGGCPTTDQLEAFGVGRLPNDALEIIAAHIEGCVACQALLHELDDRPDPLQEDLRRPILPHLFSGSGAAPDSQQAAKPDLSHQPSCTGPYLHGGEEAADPPQLGRYRITARLGAGSFGVVYKGFDHELRRDVAIKVPHRHRVVSTEDIQAYLAEARLLARLDHPGIVPVYDVGRTDDGLCYVVSRFIAGKDLRARMAEERLTRGEVVEIVARVAEALHYAHQHGLIHRDVKPANILLDTDDRPVVADFGLALREEDIGTGPEFAGTPAYMSPEQARGEGHRVDVRTDIYSLGVVFYELLSGQRPFHGAAVQEVLSQIRSSDVRPSRQLDDTIPQELDRICLKALAKRPADRYGTAHDFAADLRHWQETEQNHSPVPTLSASPAPVSVPATVPSTAGAASTSASAPTLARASVSEREPVRVVPKGLRSFDLGDADFFLELLPGPRDRDGLPESIRFWKTRLEQTDADETFSVGLLYGPSGCGKSSLVKAGLLPRLAGHVVAVYVEATPGETESHLLRGLRKRCPDLPAGTTLVEALTRLRRGHLLPVGKKMVLVLDQFEQWLHAHQGKPGLELVQALRQCDGQRVQCLVLVRDDFGMAATRFMRDLEVRIVEGQNFATVDLFDPAHARKVLAEFGQALGRLPRDGLTEEQERFLDRAVAELAQEGTIIPLRLALFADMARGKPWTLATLREVGGSRGLGVTFLEETFGARPTNPQHRAHRQAARAVLQALLPEVGSDLRGHARSYAELLHASGYARRPAEFAELLHILDAELRLVAPADPEEVEDRESRIEDRAAPTVTPDSPSSILHPRSAILDPPPSGYYQLTHDYLVPALQQWLTRKQRETWRGRAELRLAERAGLWSAHPESRHLPAGWEWANILLGTWRRDWTPPQRQMMRKASWFYLRRLNVAVLLLVLATWGLWEWVGSTRAGDMVQQLTGVDTSRVAEVIDRLKPYRRWAVPALSNRSAEVPADSRERLHLDLALLTLDPARAGPIREHWVASQKQRLRDPVRSEAERLEAAHALALCLADDPDELTPLYLEAEVPQAAILLPQVRAQSERAVALLLRTLTGPQDAGPDRDSVAKQQAHAAVALLQLGKADQVWPLLRHDPTRDPDPRLRTYLLHRLGPLGTDPQLLIQRLEDNQEDVSIRRALILGLGEFTTAQLPQQERRRLAESTLIELYRGHPDSGIHSAADWLLRRWGHEDKVRLTDQQLLSPIPQRQRRWYVNSHGHTLSVFAGPIQLQRDSLSFDPNGQPIDKDTRIPYGFAVATKEVTYQQFKEFLAAHPDVQAKWEGAKTAAHYTQGQPHAPAVGVTWLEAAQYCRWLSEREGVPPEQMCYPSVQEIQECKSGKPLRLAADYWKRTGYRLPTENEWEHACQVGTLYQSRPHGNSEEALRHYAWYYENARNRVWPVGSLKPNDGGLFDLLGNAAEWTTCPFDPKTAAAARKLLLAREHRYSIRGGAFPESGEHLKPQRIVSSQIATPQHAIGFRVARTYP